MHATRLGGLIAHILSFATRGLGYFLFVLLFAIYRRDPRAIAVLVAGVALLAALLWWTL